MSESEDQTQAPSKRRIDEAKAQGVVARSPELTSAVGLLAAVVLIGALGGSLATALQDAIRSPFVELTAFHADLETITAFISAILFRVMLPLVGIVFGVVAAMIVAHQAQVGGLWAPSLIAPDLSRIWSPAGFDWSAKAGRGMWGIAKAAIVVAVVAWAIRSEFVAMHAIAYMSARQVAVASAMIMKGLAYKIGLATLVLGLADYLMARQRVDAMLRVTPDQNREEQKAIEGDPAVRSRRMSMAKAWRADPGDVLKEAVIVVTGPAGLAVVLGGDGPPGKITVKAIGRGGSGAKLQKNAKKLGIPVVANNAISVHFSGTAARNQALSATLSQQLADLWPKTPTTLPLPVSARSPR